MPLPTSLLSILNRILSFPMYWLALASYLLYVIFSSVLNAWEFRLIFRCSWHYLASVFPGGIMVVRVKTVTGSPLDNNTTFYIRCRCSVSMYVAIAWLLMYYTSMDDVHTRDRHWMTSQTLLCWPPTGTLALVMPAQAFLVTGKQCRCQPKYAS